MTFGPSESPTSIRDGFVHDEIMGAHRNRNSNSNIDHDNDAPFDEPPQCGINMRLSATTSSSPSRNYKYRLDGCSFYQSSAAAQTTKMISETLDPRASSSSSCSSTCHSSDFDDGHSPVYYTYGYHDEQSEIWSLLATDSSQPATHNDSVSDDASSHESASRSDPCAECHDCGAIAMTGDLNALMGVSNSSFRSKPLPKPIVWKEYTCFRMGACPDAPEAGCCQQEAHTRTAQSTDASSRSEAMVEEVDPFRGCHPSLQEVLQDAKTSAQHFLKQRIFVDDSDCSVSDNDSDGDDLDSITCTSTLSDSLQKERAEDMYRLHRLHHRNR